VGDVAWSVLYALDEYATHFVALALGLAACGDMRATCAISVAARSISLASADSHKKKEGRRKKAAPA